MTRLIVSVILLALASTAQAEIYYELGIEGGGDTLIGTVSGQDITQVAVYNLHSGFKMKWVKTENLCRSRWVICLII